MITAGIDLGAKAIKALVLADGAVVGRALAVCGVDAAGVAAQALQAALQEAAVTRGQLRALVATGAARQHAPGADRAVTDVSCVARGALAACPGARTVVDVGAEEGRAIRLGPDGRVADFAINDKCAAGSGAFTEAMARALEVALDDLGPLSLQSTRRIPMNAQCAVFAESEVVSMIHANVCKPDIARAVHDAIADRVGAMVRRVGLQPPLALVGGLAHNVGFADALRRNLELDALQVPQAPEFVGALGAALIAADGAPGAAP